MVALRAAGGWVWQGLIGPCLGQVKLSLEEQNKLTGVERLLRRVGRSLAQGVFRIWAGGRRWASPGG